MEFERLKGLAEELDGNVSELEGQFRDVASTLTVPDPEALTQGLQLLDSYTEYWKNMCKELEQANISMEQENAIIREKLVSGRACLKQLEMKKDESVKYVEEKLNISLGTRQSPAPVQDDVKQKEPPSSNACDDQEATFVLAGTRNVQLPSPGIDNTILEFTEGNNRR